MTGKLTIRDVDESDLDILKVAARNQGTSLNRYVTALLHEQAQREHHRALFARIAAQEPDMPPVDSVAEVRAMRDEQDVGDAAYAAAAEHLQVPLLTSDQVLAKHPDLQCAIITPRE
ncbi:hypothetical protein [Haloactinomyces albus]|uniref:Nucleic acid-binding protein n=1 Tax=Haloactinomyces albus TaxID=1352928 RepID=A0AAE3ZGE1_9ACTN|nr:hypothetical protein [Haloactinomyces albus]MDR7303570.1 putative nucleic acid-binding protein [Haloactinomyces albus]